MDKAASNKKRTKVSFNETAEVTDIMDKAPSNKHWLFVGNGS